MAVAAPSRPNIVVLLADDLGYADLGFHGSRQAVTPNLDTLAREGVRFTNAYATCPYCSPSRAALLTGRYQQRFGHEFNPALLRRGGAGQGLPTDEITVAQRLHDAGYATALFGKWHLGEEARFHPLARGFDEFVGFLGGMHDYLAADDPTWGPLLRGRQPATLDGHLTDVLAREAADFITRHRAKPFFLCLFFNAVHTPLEAPPAHSRRFEHVADPNRRGYLGLLSQLDAAVGTVLARLKTLNLDENTLVFFLSDNGGATAKFEPNAARNDPLRGGKGDTWEGGIRVPLVARWPGTLPAGAVFRPPVIHLDIAGTALAAAGVTSPGPPLDGVNLLPYATGRDSSAPHPALYWRFGSQMAVRAGDWKLVRPSRGLHEHEDIAKEPLLFNLSDDSGETHDLAALHPGKVRELQALWDRWDAELVPPAWPATFMGKIVKP